MARGRVLNRPPPGGPVNSYRPPAPPPRQVTRPLDRIPAPVIISSYASSVVQGRGEQEQKRIQETIEKYEKLNEISDVDVEQKEEEEEEIEEDPVVEAVVEEVQIDTDTEVSQSTTSSSTSTATRAVLTKSQAPKSSSLHSRRISIAIWWRSQVVRFWMQTS